MGAVWSERNKYDRWLQVELAVCEAWTEYGSIPLSDMEKLRSATYNYERLEEILVVHRHEMTAFLQSITEGIGPEGRWLHLGLTTSDVWDTATSLQILDAIQLLDEEIDGLMEAIRTRAVEHKDTLMIGRTHGIHAEPVTFGLKLAVWYDEMRRNKDRAVPRQIEHGLWQALRPSRDARDGASIHRGSGMRALGPEGSPCIHTDSPARPPRRVRDDAGPHRGVSLEKFATEIRGLQRTEIREVSEAFPKGQPGSSSMPHKRNPELSERVCGLARLIRGHAVTALENVALWHERDISHSSAERLILPDASIALDYVLSLMSGLLRDLNVDSDRMMYNIESTYGVLFSQRVLLALIERGMERETAYGIVHNRAMESWETGQDFRDMMRSDPDVGGSLPSEDLEALFDYKYYVRHVDEIFERVGLK